MTNYTAAHESQNPAVNPNGHMPYQHWSYPDHHIEVDNRLSWFLGLLDQHYGRAPLYVHLLRRREEVASSLADRGEDSVLFSFAWGTLQHYRSARQFTPAVRYQIGLQYWDTVNANIELFLGDKPRRCTMWLHNMQDAFRDFWNLIGAKGPLDRALAEWSTRHNPRKRIPTGWRDFECDLKVARAQLTSIVSPGSQVLVADDNADLATKVLPQAHCHRWPDTELGLPADDSSAIATLTQRCRPGISYLIFLWPSFWWLTHYAVFAAHLHAQFLKILDDERVVVFDLRPNRPPFKE